MAADGASSDRRTQRIAPLMGLAAAVLPAVVLTILVAVRWHPLLHADADADRAAHRLVLAHPAALSAARDATVLGTSGVVDGTLLAVVVVLLLLRRGRALPLVLFVVLARLVELGVVTGVKVLVHRPRPSFAVPVAHARGYAFPSGHAGGAAVACAVILVVLLRVGGVPRWCRVVAGVLATCVVLAVMASRVLLGVHNPSDVVAGAAYGAVVAGVVGLVSVPRLGSRRRGRASA